MVCSKILSKEDPFEDIYTTKEILKRIKVDKTPNLPSNCDELRELIQ